ncbi:MAG: GNAT family N-acetyltransferase [Bacteroidota bacterium]
MEIIEGKIPVKTYQKMRVDCGLSAKTDEACKIGLHNSIYSLMVRDGKKIVGMGRVIGDGGCFCQVVDICVVPEQQGKGIGKIIMTQISNFIKNNLPKSCYTSLIADGNASYLYEKFGFRNTMPQSKGMYLKND